MARGSNTVVARIGLDDRGFQDGVSKVQRSLKVVQSEFAAASSKLGDFGKSTDGLRLKQDTLNKQIDIQKEKVALLSRSYDESVVKKGADAKATENLKIKLNYATAELNKMQSELKQTTTELDKKTSSWYKLSDGMEKAGSMMKTVGDKMSSAGKTLSTAVTLPIVGIGTAAAKMAMDAVESENLFEVAMGGMADGARKWSEETSKALGLNAYSVRENVATYNSMLTSMGLATDESLNMSQGLTQLSYDMASFYNLNPEEAFEKLKSGISGEAEPLKALGILVNDATIKNYAYTNGIAAQGEALTEAQKVQARYGVILEATKNAQGDLERTMDSPTNKIRAMKEQVQQLAIQFGQILIPVVEKVISVIKPLLDKFQGLSKGQQEMIVTIGLIVAAVGPLILVVGKVVSIIGTLSLAFSKVSGFMATIGSSSSLLGTVFTALTGPVGIIIGAIAGLIAIFVTLYKSNEDFRAIVNETWTQVKELIGGIIEGIKLLFNTFIEFTKQLWSKYGEDIINIVFVAFNTISSVIKSVLEVIKNIVNLVTNVIKGNWQGAWDNIKNITLSIWNGIATVITTTINIIKVVIDTVVTFISNIISGAWKGIRDTTTSVWNGIKSSITSAINGAKEGVRNALNAIVGFFKNLRLPEIKIPKIKLPHFKVNGEFSLKPPSVPKLSVEWYAKGGIFNAPSLIGVGEAGTEAVLPIDRLDDLIAKALLKNGVGTNSSSGSGLTINIEKFINNTEKDIEQLAYEFEFYRQRVSMGRGGV